MGYRIVDFFWGGGGGGGGSWLVGWRGRHYALQQQVLSVLGVFLFVLVLSISSDYWRVVGGDSGI